MTAGAAAGQAGTSLPEEVRAGDGQIDGLRISAYTFAWQSARVTSQGAGTPLAVWYDTVSIVRGDQGPVVRRVQWIVPEEGPSTFLLNEAEHDTLLPLRSFARAGDAPPFIDLHFEGARVRGRRPVLPHNGGPADIIPVELDVQLPRPLYDWRWWGILVAALPLEREYAARFLALATEPNAESPLIWITVRVIGEGNVGAVPCWQVEVQAGAPWTVWIAREPGHAPVQRIRIEQPNGDAIVWDPLHHAR